MARFQGVTIAQKITKGMSILLAAGMIVGNTPVIVIAAELGAKPPEIKGIDEFTAKMLSEPDPEGVVQYNPSVDQLPRIIPTTMCPRRFKIKATARVGVSKFGDGRDGALYIRSGETVKLHVEVPHASVVERNYTSLFIEPGGKLMCDNQNAGLVLRVQGDCTIKGTIDQTAKGPLRNPNNNYPYPPELQCGDGGSGGYGDPFRNGSYGWLGSPQLQFIYGGGIGGGGGSGTNEYNNYAGNGGSADSISITTAESRLFLGGAAAFNKHEERHGVNAGGGAAGWHDGCMYAPASCGGTGPGAAGGNGDPLGGGSINPGGGGAGNWGGGVILIYCGGTVNNSGSILCVGGVGGNGGVGRIDYDNGRWMTGGGGGGGGGGGSIFIIHGNSFLNTGILNASGGHRGEKLGSLGYSEHLWISDTNPRLDAMPGKPGTVTVKQASPQELPHKVIVAQLENGSIVASRQMAVAGETINLAINPSPGFKLESGSLTMNGSSCNSVFPMPATDAIISARFVALDNTGPSITITTQQTWSSQSNTAQVSASDPSGIAGYSLDSTNNWTGNTSYTFRDNGTHTMYCKDNLGNVSSRVFAIDHIDKTSPSVRASCSTNWSSTSQQVTIIGEDSSGISGYGLTQGGYPSSWSGNNIFTVTNNGRYCATTKDLAGNYSTEYWIEVSSIDQTAPAVSKVSVNPEGWTKNTSKRIDAIASDTQSGIAALGISTDGINFDWQQTASWNKGSGSYWIKAKDAVGRVSDAVKAIVDKIDTEPPKITSVSVPEGWGTKAEVSVNAEDLGIGVQAYAVTSGTQPSAEDWQTSNRFAITENGTWVAWCKDKLDQVTAGKQFEIMTIDVSPPDIGEIVAGEFFGNIREFTLIPGADPGISSGTWLSVQKNNEAAKNVAGPLKMNVEFGDSYKVWTADMAGNKSAVQWIFNQAPTAMVELGYWQELVRLHRFEGKPQLFEAGKEAVVKQEATENKPRVFGLSGVNLKENLGVVLETSQARIGDISVMNICFLNNKDTILARFGDYTLETQGGEVALVGRISRHVVCNNKQEQLMDVMLSHEVGTNKFRVCVDGGAEQKVTTPTPTVGNDKLEVNAGVWIANAQHWKVSKNAEGEAGQFSALPNSSVTRVSQNDAEVGNRETVVGLTKSGRYSIDVQSSQMGTKNEIVWFAPAIVPSTPNTGEFTTG